MDALAGKKLLVLGGAPNEISLVRRARELGVYVIVADYHLDRTLSPAKCVADEAWDISWSDLDGLEKKCREAHIDGVIAGYSELRVEQVVKLCERLNLPCYISWDQLEITRDKVKFKNACRRNCVPVVKEYASPKDVDHFPVIVKPVDRAGSIGISVAKDAQELEKSYRYAMEMSICKQVIIEDFISDATKFDAYYQIVEGEIYLVGTDDVINAKDNGLERVVQSAWLLPSVHQKYFIDKVDSSMRSMIQNMGIKNGYIFFSGFVNEEHEFVFFECGFRLCGGHYYEYFYQTGGYNSLDLFIVHALTGSTSMLSRKADPNPALKCATINLYAREGTVGSISGMETVAELPDCLMALTQARKGQECREDTAILSKLGIVHFCSESPVMLAENVEKLYGIVSVIDANGKDMIYDRVAPEEVLHWWDNTESSLGS